MGNDHLATYLNDHLAGSVGALEILDHLIATYDESPITAFCRDVRAEINADQDELRAILRALDISESQLRKAGAWVGEKLSRVKLRLEGEEAGEPGLFMALESLVLGIKGKEALWETLTEIQPLCPALRAFDFVRLRRRALEQSASVDEKRLEYARSIFPPRADS